MTPDDLERRCSAIYGREWQTSLARRVGVDTRTVRRWKAGDRAIPLWLVEFVGVLERHEGER